MTSEQPRTINAALVPWQSAHSSAQDAFVTRAVARRAAVRKPSARAIVGCGRAHRTARLGTPEYSIIGGRLPGSWSLTRYTIYLNFFCRTIWSSFEPPNMGHESAWQY